MHVVTRVVTAPEAEGGAGAIAQLVPADPALGRTEARRAAKSLRPAGRGPILEGLAIADPVRGGGLLGTGRRGRVTAGGAVRAAACSEGAARP